MPGSVIAEVLVQPIIEFVLYFVGYNTSRVAVPILTLGAWSVESVAPSNRAARIRAKSSLAPSSFRVLSFHVAALVGICLWVAVFAIGYLLWRGAGV